jgi:hypothetical protein
MLQALILYIKYTSRQYILLESALLDDTKFVFILDIAILRGERSFFINLIDRFEISSLTSLVDNGHRPGSHKYNNTTEDQQE